MLFAFDHLGALTARSSAFADNARSHGVSRRLGYRRDGTETVARRGRRGRTRPARRHAADPRPSSVDVGVAGYTEECRALLGGISRG